MSLNLSYKLNDISLDKTITPSWAEQIKRWSQLDDASFVLAEAVSKNMDFLSESFDQLIIVSTQGSFHGPSPPGYAPFPPPGRAD